MACWGIFSGLKMKSGDKLAVKRVCPLNCANKGSTVRYSNSANPTWNFFKTVADGWDQGRFVNFYYTRYTDTYGVAFNR